MANPTRRSSWTAWVLMLLLPLLVFGCKKMAGESAASPGYYGDYGASGGGGGGYYDEDFVEGQMIMDAESPARSRSSPMRRELAANADYKAPPPPPQDPVVADTLTVEQPKPEPTPKPVEQASHKRQIIYTATMQVSVHDVDHAIAVAEGLPEQLGGWLHQRSDNQLILRIPAEKLQEAMATIAELGVVDYRLLEALDVTAQYTDLESRIRVLEEMQAQLTALARRSWPG